jgi:hypothetical protein
VEIPDRYELKYLITESQVEAVRRFITPYCTLDPNSESEPSHQYIIRSLYFDTPRRDLYWISRQRRAHRWKMRVRQYGEGKTASKKVFLELKNKHCELVKKSRTRVPAEGWANRIRSELPWDGSSEETRFREKLERYPLAPALMVRYEREAWSSTVDFYARVTIDRQITCQPWAEWNLDGDANNWLSLDSRRTMKAIPEGVVLELKCQTSVPDWLIALPTVLGLQKTSYSKFCAGIERFWGRDSLLSLMHNYT